MKYLHYALYCRGGSGLSNIVMSAEVGVVASFLLDRTLVIEGNVTPPANVVQYKEQGVTNREMSKVTDLMDLPVPWIDAEEVDYDSSEAFFMGEKNLMDSVFYWPPDRDLSTWDFRYFARGRTEVLSETEESRAAPVVQLLQPSPEGHRMENLGFYSYFFYLDEDTRRAVDTLLRGMRPKPPYSDLAQRVSASFGDFNAVHIRRGDFKETFGVTTRDRTPDEVIRVLGESFGRDEPLVILTDERDDPFFDEITAYYTNSIFVDHHILEHHSEEFFALPRHDSIALAYLSQLVAAESKDFVGTMTSTFTSIVQRYRGNRGKNERFKFLWNELPAPETEATERGSHPPSDCVPLHPDGRMVDESVGPYSWNRVNRRINPAWQREWPESFLSPEEDPGTVSQILSAFRARATQRVRTGDVGPVTSDQSLHSIPIRASELQSEDEERDTNERAAGPDTVGVEENHERENRVGNETGGVLVDVTVHLMSGQQCQTKLESDSDILRELFTALAGGTAGAEPLPARIIQVPTDRGHGAYSFSSAQLAAIETSPPVLVEMPEVAEPREQPVADHEQPALEQPVRRRPPRVREPAISKEVPEQRIANYQPLLDFDPLPFVQCTDFLTPGELEQLLAIVCRDEAGFAAAPEHPGYRESAALDPAFAERIASRLRLLLPNVLPAFDLKRSIAPEQLRLSAQGDCDEVCSGEASAASAGADEIVCRYFFHKEPKPLSGGEIRLRKGENVHVVDPRNNVMMIYPSAACVEVLPLHCLTGAFEDSRFAVTARIA
ncbi:MAG: hypothetical protein GY946_09455 [bacterium]|nr:hypothetical protein [bacterium]